MGAKSGQKKKPPAGKTAKAAGTKRLALVVFGAILILLFVGFAVAEGIGKSGVPEGDVAVVSNVPDDVGTVSGADYKIAVAQQVASQQLKKAPKPGSKKVEELQEAALGELLDAIWIQGEAEELGISVTDKQVETELAQIKKTNFPTAKAYKEFLESSKLTQQGVIDRVRLQLLSTKIQEVITEEAPPPSNDEIANFYEENKATQFTKKPSRDVRLIFSEDKGEAETALKELKADDSAANWKVVAKKYSADPSTSSKGGLQEGLTKEALQGTGALQGAIFKAATGEVVGLTKFQTSYVIFEVEKLNPQEVQTLGEVRAQISSQLEETAKQTYFSEFVTSYQEKWTSRTTCASEFATTRCSNYKGSGHPAEAQPACYEANPKTPANRMPGAGRPEQTRGAGSVTVLKPGGEQLAQRPVLPAATGATGEAGAELPEGVARRAHRRIGRSAVAVNRLPPP